MFLQTVYLCLTELLEIEGLICIKMDMALNNQQRLICHKTQTTNQWDYISNSNRLHTGEGSRQILAKAPDCDIQVSSNSSRAFAFTFEQKSLEKIWTPSWGFVECLPMAWEIWVQSQVKSYQRLKKWYSMSSYLTLSTQVRIKGKVEQSRKKSSALLYTLV